MTHFFFFRIDTHIIYKNDLLKAVARNDIKKCKTLLEEEDIWSQEPHINPLLLAAQKGHAEIIKIVLEKGIDINVCDRKNCSALHHAIQNRRVDCSNILLDEQIDYKIKDSEGNLPLHLAAKAGLLEIVERLLKLHNVPNAMNKKNRTPLHLACKDGKDKVVSFLLENGGRWDLQDVTSDLPIHKAAFHGHYKCCTLLVQKSEERLKEQLNARNKDKSTALILAAKKGHSRCCQILKDSDINAFDSVGNTALHWATTETYLKTVEILLEMEPNIYAQNKSGNTPLHKAASIVKSSKCLRLLVEKYPGINPGLNNQNQNLLHIAALKNSYENLNFLLEIPLFLQQVNESDVKKRTPLCIALSQNHPENIELLISKGANCLIKDDQQNLPLHFAAQNGMVNICRMLLVNDRIHTVNSPNGNGETALHLAAKKGDLECCKYILKKGGDLSAFDSDGYSPFHLASSYGNFEVIEHFIKQGKGCINQVVEASGDTPLHLAVRNGSYQSCDLLLRKMKKDKILKQNKFKKCSLDEAFESEKDKIFDLILSRLEMPMSKDRKTDQYLEFEDGLHRYMHEAISEKRT